MAAAIENPSLEALKINEQKNLYLHLREYCEVLTRVNVIGGGIVEIVASGYALEKSNYVFILYSKQDWRRFFCDAIAVNIGVEHNEVVSNN